MTKTEIIKELSGKTGLEKSIVEACMESFINSVQEHLIHKEDISLRGFGTFTAKKRAAKVARNISKNTTITVPSRYVPVFRPSAEFIKAVKDSN